MPEIEGGNVKKSGAYDFSSQHKDMFLDRMTRK